MPIEDFNISGDPGPAFQMMEFFTAQQAKSAELIGEGIHRQVQQTEVNNQTKGMASDAQAMLQQNGNSPQALMGSMIQLAGKYPMAAQSETGQMVLQTLGARAAGMMPIAPNPVTGADGSGAPGGDAQGGMAQPTSGTTTTSTFATPADQALSAKTGGKQGDSGTGAWGNYTGQGSGPQVSFPESTLKSWFGDDWKKKAYGQPVNIYANGKKVQATIGDMGPAKWTKAGMDMNPDAAAAVGISDPDNFKGDVSYAIGGRVTNTTPSFSKPGQSSQASPQSGGDALDTLGSQANAVNAQLSSVNQIIARMGPVTPNNHAAMSAQLSLREKLQSQSDSLAEKAVTAQQAKIREAREARQDQEREIDRTRALQDREDAQTEKVKKDALDQQDREASIKRLQQAQTDKEKAEAQTVVDKKIKTVTMERTDIEKQQTPLLKSISAKEVTLRNLTSKLATMGGSDSNPQRAAVKKQIQDIQKELEPQYQKKGQLENDLQRTSQTVDQLNAGMTASEYQQTIANAKAAIAKNPAVRATVIAGLEDAGITHSGL